MQAKASRLDRSFYHQDVLRLAKALLGKVLVRMKGKTRLAGRIVETEAYLGIPDKAAHTVGGRRTPRNESMWQDGGTLYVYFTYGMHHCMNIVAQQSDEPVAVLIRALEPLEGMDVMYTRRKVAKKDKDLCSGPAKLCQALDISREQDGIDLVSDSQIWIEDQHVKISPIDIATGPRIGVQYAQEWADKPYRFWIKDHSCVSR
ncbi:MAG TPA: DNA-3-methyladenine glycosylase [Phycisphaerales bacterium]|nr:DNA-3-methyladenine glycosylase [Phycisphaerales bacterium]